MWLPKGEGGGSEQHLIPTLGGLKLNETFLVLFQDKYQYQI